METTRSPGIARSSRARQAAIAWRWFWRYMPAFDFEDDTLPPAVERLMYCDWQRDLREAIGESGPRP